MVKESSLRLFMAVLLAIQAVCWSLTLLDLISPGKPLSLLRTSGDMVSQMLSSTESVLDTACLKTLGLLRGMSWESTVTYYQVINRRVREVKGGLHSVSLVMYYFDLAKIAELQHAGEWEEAGLLLNDAAVRLKSAGADGIVLCTNTMHFEFYKAHPTEKVELEVIIPDEQGRQAVRDVMYTELA
ncbi:hypothetical protein PMIN02_006379 [Paraphaeosphaeria minitans]